MRGCQYDAPFPKFLEYRMRSEGRAWTVDRVLGLAAIVFLATRLPFLLADSVGIYNAHDEGLTNSDARSLVLHGTIFYDTYNPSLLMPFFTLVKAPFFWLFGVNPIGLRLPSTLCGLAAMLLLALPLRRRGESVALKLLLIQMTASYFWFSHSIAGIREPVLALASALSAYWLERAFHSRKTSDYAAAFLLCAAVPLVKTSGVYMPAAFAVAIAWKLATRRGEVPSRGLAAGLLAAGLLWAAVLLLWWLPHRQGVWEYYDLEVASRANPDALGSFGRLMAMLFVVAPGLTALAGLAAFRLADQAIADRRSVDDWDVILLAWAGCSLATLVFPIQGYWRWLMWPYPALAALAAREWARWSSCGLGDSLRPKATAARLAAVFAALAVVTQAPFYVRHARALDFSLLRLTRETEAMVGDAVVSGSIFEDMSAFSSKLNFVSGLTGQRLRNCEDVRNAYPAPAMTPAFLADYAGPASRPEAEVLRDFYAGCPQWKKQYRPLGRVPRSWPEGGADMWFVRERPRPFTAGVNYPWNNYGWDFGETAWGHRGVSEPAARAAVEKDFAYLASKGVTLARWFVFADGRASPEFDAKGLPIGLDEHFFADFDVALEIARRHGIRLMPVLFDFHLFDPPKRVKGVQLGGRGGIVTDPKATAALIERALLPLFRRYGQDPTIYAWDIFNEPELRIKGVKGPGPRVVDRKQVLAFVKRVAAVIHAETRQPATVGAWKRSLVAQWKGAGLDLYQFHHYEDRQREPYDRPYAALKLDKPCLVGEFPTKKGERTLEWYLDAAKRNGYSGALAWSYKAQDDFSDFPTVADRFAAWARSQ